MKRLLLALVLVFAASPAGAVSVTADLSSHKIDVSVGFSGTSLLIFGALEYPADVAVVVKGPAVSAKLWTKRRELGIWVNSNAAAFPRIPGYYAIATTQPVADIASPEMAARYDLTLADLAHSQNRRNQANRLQDYLALTQAQQVRGLYQENPGSIHVVENKLFRVDFDLPDSVPIGAYKAYIYLLQGGKVVATKSVPFTVEQVGVEASIYRLAHYRPFGYAFLALAASLGLGGAAAYLFRRMS